MASHPSYHEIEAYCLTAPGSAQPPDEAGKAVAQHVRGCEQCAELADRLRTVDSELQTLKDLPGQNHESCPAMEEWLRLAAGLTKDEPALRLLEHAGHCRSCARSLEEAKLYLAADQVPTPELKSSTEEWQRDAARLIVVHTQKPTQERRRFLFKWVLAGATALVVFAFAIFLRQLLGSDLARTDRLLAEAYTGNRTLEMRFPGAHHSLINPRRGDTGSSRFNGLDSSTSFRSAVENVTEELRRRPEDPAWLVRRARIDLLDWHYKPALSTLDQMSASATDNPQVLATRALAEFERGEVEKRSEDFARAEEDLTRALKLHPDDSTLLFNRALIYEKMMMYENARDDWGQVLKLETDAGWRAEAQEHLAALEEKKTPISNR